VPEFVFIGLIVAWRGLAGMGKASSLNQGLPRPQAALGEEKECLWEAGYVGGAAARGGSVRTQDTKGQARLAGRVATSWW
jgi:hypothetical protein